MALPGQQAVQDTVAAATSVPQQLPVQSTMANQVTSEQAGVQQASATENVEQLKQAEAQAAGVNGTPRCHSVVAAAGDQSPIETANVQTSDTAASAGPQVAVAGVTDPSIVKLHSPQTQCGVGTPKHNAQQMVVQQGLKPQNILPKSPAVTQYEEAQINQLAQLASMNQGKNLHAVRQADGTVRILLPSQQQVAVQSQTQVAAPGYKRSSGKTTSQTSKMQRTQPQSQLEKAFASIMHTATQLGQEKVSGVVSPTGGKAAAQMISRANSSPGVQAQPVNMIKQQVCSNVKTPTARQTLQQQRSGQANTHSPLVLTQQTGLQGMAARHHSPDQGNLHAMMIQQQSPSQLPNHVITPQIPQRSLMNIQGQSQNHVTVRSAVQGNIRTVASPHIVQGQHVVTAGHSPGPQVIIGGQAMAVSPGVQTVVSSSVQQSQGQNIPLTPELIQQLTSVGAHDRLNQIISNVVASPQSTQSAHAFSTGIVNNANVLNSASPDVRTHVMSSSSPNVHNTNTHKKPYTTGSRSTNVKTLPPSSQPAVHIPQNVPSQGQPAAQPATKLPAQTAQKKDSINGAQNATVSSSPSSQDSNSGNSGGNQKDNTPQADKKKGSQASFAKIIPKGLFLEAQSKGVDPGTLPSVTQYIENEPYIMVYASGKLIEAIYKKQHFAVVRRPQLPQLVIAEQNSTAVRGGGRKSQQKGVTKGSSSGLQMINSEYSDKKEDSDSSSCSDVNQLKRRPLHQDGQVSKATTGTLENGEVAAPAKAKRATQPDVYALCPHCGTTSGDYDICDSCKKSLPEDVKLVNRKKDTSLENPLEPKTFYGDEPRKTYSKKDAEASTRKAEVGKKPGRKGKRNEPETVILSSDDEEEVARKRKKLLQQQQAAAEASLCKKSDASDELKGGSRTPTTPASNKQGGRKTPSPPSLTPQQPLQDKSLKLPLRQVHIGSLVLTAAEPLKISPSGIFFKLNFGTVQVDMQIQPKEIESVTCGLEGQTMPALILHSTPECGHRVRKMFQLQKTGPYFDPQSSEDKVKKITFVMPRMGPNADKIVTEIFGLMPHHHVDRLQKPFLQMVDETEMKSLLIQYEVLVRKSRPPQGAPAQAPPAAPPPTPPSTSTEDGEEEDRSRSPSPLPRTFQGEIIKMFTYPPPPATGGIAVTNEDYFCLNEGEFLNDVIIDFYLKYLYLNKLSEENKAKTHIFSSFFYRRLTQREPRSMHTPDELRLPLPERRHNRVKTWTRHVDLFAKDFIIVPINESSHWYLAVICWPGLKQPAHVEYRVSQEVPMSALTPEERRQHGLDENSEEGVSKDKTDENSQEEPMDTSEKGEEETGKTKDTPAKEKMFNRITSFVALRQACILIFDSLSGGARNGVIKMLREYLDIEWKSKKAATEGPRVFDKDTVRGCNVKCPQQTNFSDCGVYVLQYVQSFFENPIASYTVPMHLENWFGEEIVLKKRDELKSLIIELKKQLSPDLKVPDIDDVTAS